MTERILIMGLPGAGKTYLAQYVLERLQNAGKRCSWLNADDVRKKYNDWDFSQEGRIRQSLRMRELADAMIDVDYVICDFIAPLAQMRINFDAQWTVWVDTITQGRFEDTNKLFEPPEHYDFRIKTQDAPYWSELVAHSILGKSKPPIVL
jgi:adenylylsulfate kinase